MTTASVLNLINWNDIENDPLTKGVVQNIKNLHGETPLDIAIKKKYYKIYPILYVVSYPEYKLNIHLKKNNLKNLNFLLLYLLFYFLFL